MGTICFPNSSNGSYYIYLVKTDPYGNKQWDKMFGSSDGDVAAGYPGYGGVQQTSDGGYIIVGDLLYSHVPWKIDIYLLKTDANGNKQWDKTFSKWAANYGTSIQQTSDGGYIIVGQVVADSNKDREVYLMKTDTNGDKQWDKIFGNGKGGGGESVKQTTDGGYILTGSTDGNKHIYLVKTDANGNKQWDKTSDNSGWNRGECVQQTRDGGYIIAGFINGNGTVSTAYLVKTDASGNKQWDKRFGRSGGYTVHSVQQTTDGGYIISGRIDVDRHGYIDLIKLRPES